MRRTLTPLLFLPTLLASAQQNAHTPAHLPHEAEATHEASARSASIPVTRISLYKNGVGFFEHTGFVTGNASVTLDFTSGQLNDVLQSLTVLDLGGGRISGAGYNSTTPLDQQLKALSLGLGEKTTFSGLFTALRGTRVQVSGSGAPFTGRLVDIEMHKTGPGKEAAGMTEGRFLTVASDSGDIRIFQMTPSLTVRLLDTTAHTDLSQYLQLLDSNRNQGLRHLTLLDLAPAHSAAPRTLQLSYISEVPIWKSTYRILFTDPATSTSTQTATLQGWSVVDNTTGIDWINVHLSLIAGAPQSFIQPLSDPIYSRRPEIPIAQDPQLTPQTYESSITGPPPPPQAPAPTTIDGLEQKSFMMNRIGPGAGGNTGVGMMHGSPSGVFAGVAGGSGAGPISYEDAASTSLIPQTTTTAFDDFFRYDIADPITIRKNESALVPILQTKITADRVTLVSSNGNSVQQPLRALWITNTSNLTLDRGSFTLIENGNFGGEGLLDPIHPGEKRLLSYAADQAIHVTTESNLTSKHIDRVTAAKGVLKLHSADVKEITYLIHNAAAEPRTVVLEHPIYNGYKLDSDPAATETTGSLYRFRTVVQPGQTERLHVGEKHRGATTYQLTRSDENQIQLILRETNEDPKLLAALQPILTARRAVADAQTAVDQTNARLKDLRSDEDRQRSNITALANADKSSRDRFVRDLNKTEDAITAAQTELTTRTTALDAAKADLSNRIEAFQIDEPL